MNRVLLSAGRKGAFHMAVVEDFGTGDSQFFTSRDVARFDPVGVDFVVRGELGGVLVNDVGEGQDGLIFREKYS